MTTTKNQTTKPQGSSEFALRVWSLHHVISSIHPNPKPHLTLLQTETGEEKLPSIAPDAWTGVRSSSCEAGGAVRRKHRPRSV